MKVLACLAISLAVTVLAPPIKTEALGINTGYGTISLDAFIKCKAEAGWNPIKRYIDCTYVYYLADPEPVTIGGLNLSLAFDPNKFSFNPNLSGFLCDLSADGNSNCPISNSQLGTYMAAVGTDFLPVSQPLPGSSVAITYDNLAGLVSLDYSLASPVNITQSQNFLALAFEFKKPFNATQILITNYDKQGDYDINVSNFQCRSPDNQGVSCDGNPPVRGSSLTIVNVPEPTSTISLLALGTLGAASTLKRKLKPSTSSKKDDTKTA
jgi:hypothetical protein